MADLKQELGAHTVVLRELRFSEEDGGFISIGFKVEFKDGEKGWKFVNNKTDKGLQHMRKTLKAVGFDCDKNDLASLMQNPEALYEAECEAVVGENNYKGVISNRIDWLNPLKRKPSADALAKLTQAVREVKGKDENIPTVVPDQDGGL